jgi:outer membrane immunogenic protein
MTVSLDYLGTVRGRLGYTVDRFLVYGTAGLAYGGGEVAAGGLSNSKTHVGWTVGAGVEAMIAPNITARLEYLFADLGKENYTTVLGPARVGIDTSIVRAAMNYKF